MRNIYWEGGWGNILFISFSPWQTLHQCYFFPSCAPPTPLCILYFISIHFLFFFPGKLSFRLFFFLNPSQPNPNIFLPALGWEGFKWLPQDKFHSVSSPLLNVNFVIFYILLIFFFFPGKLSSTVILFLNLSQPNPNIFLPVLGREGFTWLPQDKFYSVFSPLLNLNFVIFYILFIFFLVSLANFP